MERAYHHPLTRREIFDYLRVASFSWYGQVDELSFLGRLYDLGSLPSNDSRYKTADRSCSLSSILSDSVGTAQSSSSSPIGAGTLSRAHLGHRRPPPASRSLTALGLDACSWCPQVGPPTAQGVGSACVSRNGAVCWVAVIEEAAFAAVCRSSLSRPGRPD
jgi:AbiJ N-terminal domain 3